QRCTSDASGSGEHHQARHALQLDAGLAELLRLANIGYRLLLDDLLPRVLKRGERPEDDRVAERDEVLDRVDCARTETLLRHWLRKIACHERPRPRTVGANAERRFG